MLLSSDLLLVACQDSFRAQFYPSPAKQFENGLGYLVKHPHNLANPFLWQAPRGLSAEEKRVKLLEIFHETVSGRF